MTVGQETSEPLGESNQAAGSAAGVSDSSSSKAEPAGLVHENAGPPGDSDHNPVGDAAADAPNGGEQTAAALLAPEVRWLHRKWPGLFRPNGFPRKRTLAVAAPLIAIVGVLVPVVLAIFDGDSSASEPGTTIATQVINNYFADETPEAQADPETKSCGASDETEVRGGWGPDRPTFVLNSVPTYTTFNSIRDNPQVGDERGMVRVSEVSSSLDYGYEVNVQEGKTYRISMFVENSAAATIEGLAASNVRAMFNLPVCDGNRIAIHGFVTSNDAFPRQVWGGVTLTSDRIFNLRYVEGSAVQNSNAADSPAHLDEAMFTSSGVLIGMALDGNMRPLYSDSVFINFDVQPQFAPEQ